VETILQSLILSASLGALIGLIRQWAEQQEAGKDDIHIAGLRTFILWAILGYTAAFASAEYGMPVFVALLLIVGGHIVLQGLFSDKADSMGLTTGAAALITLFLGALIYQGQLTFAVMLAALTMIILGLKQSSHAWTRRFTQQDIRSTLQFVAVTGVILPLVPNQGYGPYEALNPYSIWWMVVLISGLGFVGYILMRWLDARSGVLLTGIIGGLASSTATTLAFSRESKVYPALSRSFALAIVMACTIMLGRVLIILCVIHPDFLPALWLPFTIIALPGLLYALIVHLSIRKEASAVELPNLKNPLGLSIAVKFALIYGIITLLVTVFTQSDLTSGLLALSFISGLTDMDAIALSVTHSLKDSSIGYELATRAVILAAIANTLLKGGLVFALGSSELRKQIAIAFGGIVLAGLVAFSLV
jgi:uncharacterized membrane protein (DUF4010 family)